MDRGLEHSTTDRFTDEIVEVETSGNQPKAQPGPEVFVSQARLDDLVRNIGELAHVATVVVGPADNSDQPQEALSQRGKILLVRLYGSEWQKELGVADNQDLHQIAWIIANSLSIKKPNTPEIVASRIEGLLSGKTNEEIAGQTQSTPGAVGAFFHLLPKRIADSGDRHRQSRLLHEAQGPPKLPKSELTEDDLLEIDRDVILNSAIEDPDSIEPEVWRKAAESEIKILAIEAGFKDFDAAILWDRIHFDEEYKTHLIKHSPETEHILNILNRRFIKSRSSKFWEGHRLERKAIVELVTGKTLDDIHSVLSSRNPDITPSLTERYVVAAVREVLYNV